MYSQNDYRSYSLYHHGIKGQKWGIRRYQNSDGSLTAAGKDRYNVGSSSSGKGKLSEKISAKIANSKEKYISNLSDVYKQDYDLTDEEAREAAEKHAEFVKKALIASAVVVGASVSIYAARQIGRNYLDEVIKAGTNMQTLSADKDRLTNGKAFYSAFRKGDMAKYRGMFGAVGTQNKYKIQYAANKDMKIASSKTASKIYDKLIKENPEFRQAVSDSETIKDAMGKVLGGAGRLKDYERFNTYGLLGNEPNDMKAQKIFYEKLKEAGYSGLHDINDRKNSGFNTKANIIFDKDSWTINRPIEKVKDSEIASGLIYAELAMIRDAALNPVNVATGALVFGAFKSNANAQKNIDDVINRRKEKKKDAS